MLEKGRSTRWRQLWRGDLYTGDLYTNVCQYKLLENTAARGPVLVVW